MVGDACVKRRRDFGIGQWRRDKDRLLIDDADRPHRATYSHLHHYRNRATRVFGGWVASCTTTRSTTNEAGWGADTRATVQAGCVITRRLTLWLQVPPWQGQSPYLKPDMRSDGRRSRRAVGWPQARGTDGRRVLLMCRLVASHRVGGPRVLPNATTAGLVWRVGSKAQGPKGHEHKSRHGRLSQCHAWGLAAFECRHSSHRQAHER